MASVCYVTKLPKNVIQARRTCPGLLKWMEELQPKEAHFPDQLLPQDLRHDGWSLVRDEAGRRGSWSGDGQMNSLIRPKDMRGRNTSAICADVESLGELDEFGTGGIGAPHEDRDLQADAWGASS